MGEIFVVAEHRQGELREVTLEMLFKANELSRILSHTLTAVMIGAGDETFMDELTKRADRVIAVENEQLRSFNADLQKEVLHRLIEEHNPFLTLMGHTPWGMDLAPCLSIKSGLPLYPHSLWQEVIRSLWKGREPGPFPRAYVPSK